MLADIRAAFAFLTILPTGSPSGRRRGWAIAFFPLVGLCIGALLVAIATHSPFDRDLSAFLILLVWVAITGGLHLDGFGDSCDGLLAAVAPEERRRIMRDPRAGMWAVAGTTLLLLGKWLAIRAAPAELLILAPVLGRWALVLAAYAFPAASEISLAAAFRDGLGRLQVITAALWLVILLTNVELLALAVGCSGFSLAFGWWAARRLGGGLSGDVYGAVCELTELLSLLALAALYG
ncbi:MAG: adenosylcobinamide-GDP ribazoletransferase [Chloroflexi bacterium]|nr:adenosylcobinamide-GDP ribazoletransferase [Chloroflexota bacterium]